MRILKWLWIFSWSKWILVVDIAILLTILLSINHSSRCKLKDQVITNTKQKPSITNWYFLNGHSVYFGIYYSWWNNQIRFIMVHFNIKMQKLELVLKCVTYAQPIPLTLGCIRFNQIYFLSCRSYIQRRYNKRWRRYNLKMMIRCSVNLYPWILHSHVTV